MMGLGRSLSKMAGEADRINFAGCGVTETTKIQGCLRNKGSMERIRKWTENSLGDSSFHSTLNIHIPASIEKTALKGFKNFLCS